MHCLYALYIIRYTWLCISPMRRCYVHECASSRCDVQSSGNYYYYSPNPIFEDLFDLYLTFGTIPLGWMVFPQSKYFQWSSGKTRSPDAVARLLMAAFQRVVSSAPRRNEIRKDLGPFSLQSAHCTNLCQLYEMIAPILLVHSYTRFFSIESSLELCGSPNISHKVTC